MARSPKGGAFGANGEWYEGGKFINTVPANRKREGSARKGSGKTEVAPYLWEVAPAGKVSIYRQLAGIHGKVIDGRFVLSTNPTTLAYFGVTLDHVTDLAIRWNNGERWVEAK